jgi:glycosyltransferase involved in cell wall biosynthesis
VFELTRVVIRDIAARLNPWTRGSIRRARLILAQNEDTRRWLPRGPRRRAVVLPNAVLDSRPPGRDRRPGPPTALFVGRLIAWKGVHLAIRALAELPEWRLLVCGTGTQEARLRALAAELGLDDRIDFLGWQERDEVLRLMRESADVLVFPSLHDEAGMVVVEAGASGLPVVCLDRGGPPALGGLAVPAGSEAQTVRGLAAAIAAAASRPCPPMHVRDIADARDEVRAALRDAGLPAGGHGAVGQHQPGGGP